MGVTRIELREGDRLFVSVTLPNIILGTVGGGTGLPTQAAGLNIMGLKGEGKVRVFGEVCAATCLAARCPLNQAPCMVAGWLVDVCSPANHRPGRMAPASVLRTEGSAPARTYE